MFSTDHPNIKYLYKCYLFKASSYLQDRNPCYTIENKYFVQK